MATPFRPDAPVVDAYEAWDHGDRGHRAGAFPTDVLRLLERMLPPSLQASAETGCGKSTILFSNISAHHTVFCLDDRKHGAGSSVAFFQQCPLTKPERIEAVFGPTQRTLPLYQHARRYQAVLLDGPHGWPAPELEYHFLYPHIETDGLLILDDCHIPTIGRMADVLAEDPMWRVEGLAAAAVIFRRTEAPLFDPLGDGWWEQPFNRRRVPAGNPFHLGDRPPADAISSLRLPDKLLGNA